MAKKRKQCYSGIGGQAVLEGVMMKNDENYAVAVRKPDGSIALELANYQGLAHGSRWKKLPFIRGVINFIDSLVLGYKCLSFSTAFYEEEDTAPAKESKLNAETMEKLMSVCVMVCSIALAIGIFIVLPYWISSLLEGFIRNHSLMLIIEGVLRIAIFLLYVSAISLMKDIRRLYRYHGAEHKCINCLERGKPLTVKNVMRSSRLHKRCGTSFIFFVLIVSIVLSFFITVENPLYKVLLRVLMMPLVAGISYELIRLAGRSDHFLIGLLSFPGMAIQRLTTKEPDESMVEVAIASVEAVFDWKTYLKNQFGYEPEVSGAEEDV